MRLKNIEEFRKKMQERGWDADAYIAEVDRKIAEQGYYNEDVTMHPEDNYGYCDYFNIVEEGIWERVAIDDKSDRKICRYSELGAREEEKYYYEELSEPVYVFDPRD